MGERKVLNKYYPPDFDPSKIPRRRQPKNQQIKVRMMLPMSIRCSTCGNYIYKGTKFNSRKEDAVGETYLGIQVFRFYFKCTKCSAEITFKTDPQNSDYIVESGATRNFEPWRAEDEAEAKETKKREAEEMGDAMKSLENRTLDSKREMDILAALDEMKSMKSRHASVSVDAMLEALQHASEERERKIEEEDEAILKSIVFHNSKDFVLRIDDNDEDDDIGEDHHVNLKRKRETETSTSGTERKATDMLTIESISDKPKETSSDIGKSERFVFKSKSMAVKIVKKPPVPSQPVEVKSLDITKQEGSTSCKEGTSKNISMCAEQAAGQAGGTGGSTKHEESTGVAANAALQSLCAAYSSDEDE
ncbi:Coiled-coil domain-containing protein [Nymphaea thermarum]|nr:Coiled-coil domain-containing protein [Nymphaea thermarum]